VPESDSIGAAILRSAELRPDLPAVVATGFQTLSYGELKDYLTCTAAQLRQSGFDRTARIAVALPSGAQAALTIVASACAAVAVPIDTHLTAPEIERRLELLRPRAIITPGEYPSVARSVAEHCGLAVIEATAETPTKIGMGLRIPTVGPTAAPEGPESTAPAFILQTSGTTGDPKLIPFTHCNMLAAAARVQSWFDLGPSDRCLSVSPVCYSHGLKVTIFTPLITGGSIAFPASSSTLDVDEWLTRLRPTWYSAAPTLHRYMLDKTQSLSDLCSVHSLRFILSGGAPLLRDIREALAATLGVPVLEHYGSSEAAQISANLPPPKLYRAGTCGVPPEGTVKIVGDDGQELSAGQQGEILVGGPTVTSGYLHAPELNHLAFVDDWFRTGDVGSIDSDGFLTLHGREKELINRGGEKVSPVEIDQALLQHPNVAEAAAFAVPHSRLGEEVAAAVVLREGATVTPLDLRKFLLSSLAQFKIPRRIVFVDRLPKGVTGKVQRKRLSELLK
jgi:oxalate---CoA ligase